MRPLRRARGFSGEAVRNGGKPGEAQRRPREDGRRKARPDAEGERRTARRRAPRLRKEACRSRTVAPSGAPSTYRKKCP